MTRKPGVLALLLPLAIVAGVACEEDDTSGLTDQAQVRVVHASANAPNVDVLVNNDVVLSNVAYTQFSGYLPVDAGTQRLRVRAAGTSTTVIDATPSLMANTSYTVLAIGALQTIEPLVLQDDRAAPAAGSAKVRIVHAAPAAGNVDIYVTEPNASLTTATPTVANAAYKAVSGFLTVPAGTYRVRVTPAGNRNTVAIDVPTLTFTSGQIVTAVAAENVGGGAPFRVLLVN